MKSNHRRQVCGLNLLYIRPGYRGGTVRYAFRLFRELLEQSQYEWYVYVRAGIKLPEEFYRPNVHLRVINIKGSIVGRVLYEQVILPFKAQKDGVQLLFSPGFVTPLWGRFKKVVTVHDMYFHLFPNFVRRWQRQYWKVFIPLSLRAADSVITVSNTTRRDLISYFPDSASKSRAIPLGVSAHQEMANDEVLNFATPYCLVVGNLTPNKNIGLVVDAIKALNEEGVECRLKIVGHDLEGELDRHIKKHGDGGVVELLSGVNDEELWRLYREAACTIQASMYEGFGLPVLEAMALGSPVIISDADALQEVAGDAALMFNRHSSAALTRAIKRVLQEDGFRDKLRKRGWQNVRLYTWAETARKTAGVFRNLLARV